MPDFKRAIQRRLSPLRLAPARHAEIVEELSQHLHDRYAELRAAGTPAADAEHEALAEISRLARQLAGIERPAVQEPPVSGAGAGTMLRTITHDIRYALRTFARTPGFTAVVLLTLALGIGATTAIFSVLDGVMLRPFPYPNIDRIMILSEVTRSGQAMSVAWANFQDWRDRNEVFEHLGIYRGMTVNLTGGDQPERLNASLVSSEAFRALGVQPRSGRVFRSEDDAAGVAPIAVVSERLWRTRFNADPSLVGKSIALNGQAHTVVGIMPPGMRFPSRLTDVWLPLGLFVGTFPTARGAHPNLTAVGTLRSGVSVEQARANMDAIARQLERAFPLSNTDHTVAVTPYYEQIVGNIRPALLTLIGAVGFLLLIGCANLANLMVARAERRRRELAIRAALGAGRWRIAQQLLTESVVLALAGGALGALVAWWGVKAFVASRPTTVPRIDLIAVDLRVLAFAAVVSIATGVAFGLAPALRSASPDLLTSLKEAARSSGRRGRRLQSTLVIAEVAMTLVLLLGAGLTLKSFARLTAIDLGFDPQRVVTMRMTLPAAKYAELPRWMAFHDEVLRRVTALPALDAVGLNSAVPLEGGGSESEVVYEGQPPPKSVREEGTMCLFQASTPDYFRAMGIPLVQGRSFTDRDSADAVQVAVVDETLVRRLFPNADPIGKRIAFEFRGRGPDDPQPIWREIVGVVRHVRHYGLTSEPPNVQVYVPFRQFPIWFQERRPSMALVVRTRLEPDHLAASIRQAVTAVDRDIPVYGIQTMDAYVGQALEQSRINVTLLSCFGSLALVLAMLGIYSVLSYLVGRRTNEIGIRLALGATRGDIMRVVVGHGVTLAAAGTAIGVAAGWALAQSMRAFLFELSPHDPTTYAGIVTLVAAVAIVASFVPARRATRIDPLIALRNE